MVAGGWRRCTASSFIHVSILCLCSKRVELSENLRPAIRMSLGEVLYGPLSNECLCSSKMSGNVACESFTFLLVQHAIEVAGLGEVILVAGVVPLDIRCRDLLEVLFVSVVALRSGKAVGEIVGSGSLVSIDAHESISLVVSHAGGVRTIDGDLKIVGSKSVTMSVIVGEETSLKHLVGTGLNSWNKIGRGEGELFHLGEVVRWIFVQNQLSNWDKREFGMGPDLGKIEWIEFVFLSFLRSHDLDVHCVRRILSGLDSVVKIAD